MRFSLIPRDEHFFDLLEEHAKRVHQSVQVFQEMLHDWSPQHPSIQKIRDLEHEGDMTAHEILSRLNRTFVTPIDREDIHLLTKQIDDVLDILLKVAVRLQLFTIEKITPELASLTKLLEEASGVVVKAISSIRHLDRPQRILDYCIEINQIEDSADQFSDEAILRLFSDNKETLEVIKWKEIYDTMEMAIDTCEDIANTIQGVVIKYG